MVDVFTSEEFFRPFLGEQVQILQRHHDSLNVPEHGGQSQTEEHDEEQHGPQRRDGHLSDGLGEDDEGQTGSLHSLKPNIRAAVHLDISERLKDGRWWTSNV